jgi:hypothetical protein
MWHKVRRRAAKNGAAQKRRRLGLTAACSFSTSRRSAVTRFSGFPFKERGGVALRNLGDASWLDGGARAASERLGNGGGMESKWWRDLVL